MTMIVDGEGSGVVAGVSDQNRLKTVGVDESKYLELVSQGRGFTFSTGIVNLTSSSASSILTFVNDGDSDVIFPSYSITSNKSQEESGTPNTQSSIIVTISAGILVNPLSTAITPAALNDEGLTPDVTILGGTEGDSVTTAVDVSSTFVQHGNAFGVAAPDAPFFLKKNGSIAVKITPPSGTSTGNDRLRVTLGGTFYISDGRI
jgi:hypothetical protein